MSRESEGQVKYIFPKYVTDAIRDLRVKQTDLIASGQEFRAAMLPKVLAAEDALEAAILRFASEFREVDAPK